MRAALLLALVIFESCSYRCKKVFVRSSGLAPDPLPEVDWWFAHKIRSGASYYYYDKDFDDAKKDFEFYSEEHDNAHVGEDLFFLHANDAYKQNLQWMDNWNKADSNPPGPVTSKGALKHDLPVFQIWFNDQQDKSNTKPRMEGNWDQKREGKWLYQGAHAKMLLTIHKNGGGYLLQHSFPETPDLGSDNGKSGQSGIVHRNYIPAIPNDQEIRKNWDITGTLSLSQHAFCMSFDAKDTMKVLETMKLSYLKPMWSNAPLDWWSLQMMPLGSQSTTFKYQDEVFTILNDIVNGKLDRSCNTEWKKNIDSTKYMKAQVPDPHCTKPVDLAGSINPGFKLIAHLPTLSSDRVFNLCSTCRMDAKNLVGDGKPLNTKRPKRKKSILSKPPKKKQKVVPPAAQIHRNALELGPIPWVETARALSTELYLAVVYSKELPSYPEDDPVVMVVDELQFSGKRRTEKTTGTVPDGLQHTNPHEKWAVATDQTWFCSGDNNHRLSEMTHAGLKICMIPNHMSALLESFVKSVVNRNHFPNFPKMNSAAICASTSGCRAPIDAFNDGDDEPDSE